MTTKFVFKLYILRGSSGFTINLIAEKGVLLKLKEGKK